jgi:Tfp pilus assembly protein FimV
MALRVLSIALVSALLLASSAAGETIYKYRQADGQVIYSNRPISGAVLLEQFEYEPPAQARIEGDAEKNRLDAEQRIAKHLAALEQAWNEVQDARQALARAEERLRAQVEPKADEPRQLAGSADAAPPAAGGPSSPAPPAVGGPQTPASPAVGGPMGRCQGGGGRSPEFQERTAALEADVRAAQERLDAALRRYNSLR